MLPERNAHMAESSVPRHRRALIVDDEIFFAINLEADMHALGFDVCDLAANGQQATMLAMRHQPDVVLMDVNLEDGREGIEVARWLRKVCATPIVVVTSYTDPDTVARIHEQVPGAPVLSKPACQDRLARAVARVCGAG
jgi:CheY-like chemotaxis protein